jgi:hypothetical protein
MINKYGTEVNKPKGAISKTTELKNLMRSDALKFLMQLPLKEFAKKNIDLQEFIEIKFGKQADDMTVGIALAYQNISHNIMNPNPKDFSYIQAEIFGKVKEETTSNIIELPIMQDATDMLESIDTKTLERLLEQRKISESIAPIEPAAEMFELTS